MNVQPFLIAFAISPWDDVRSAQQFGFSHTSERASAVPIIHNRRTEPVLSDPHLLRSFSVGVAQMRCFPHEIFKWQCWETKRQPVDRTDTGKEGISGHEGNGRGVTLGTWPCELTLKLPGCAWMGDRQEKWSM